MRGLSPLSGERCQSKKTWLTQPPNMTFEEDFIVKEKSQTLESQFLLWDIGNPSHGGNSTEKTVKKKKMKREEEKRSSSETQPWYVTNHRGEPPLVPHLVAGGLRPQNPTPTPPLGKHASDQQDFRWISLSGPPAYGGPVISGDDVGRPFRRHRYFRLFSTRTIDLPLLVIHPTAVSLGKGGVCRRLQE